MSKFATNLLQQLPHVNRTLNYGSGKLRYLNQIESKTHELFLVDSVIQNTRTQKIFDKKQSVKDFSAGKNSLHVLSTKEIIGLHNHFDRVVLFNVLQVVPIFTIRQQILLRSFKCLKPQGQLIASVQYRNSDFNRMAKMNNARSFKDGILIDHIRGTSFYGFIKPLAFQTLIRDAGFEINRIKLHDGSCYVWATKPG